MMDRIRMPLLNHIANGANKTISLSVALGNESLSMHALGNGDFCFVFAGDTLFTQQQTFSRASDAYAHVFDVANEAFELGQQDKWHSFFNGIQTTYEIRQKEKADQSSPVLLYFNINESKYTFTIALEGNYLTIMREDQKIELIAYSNQNKAINGFFSYLNQIRIEAGLTVHSR